MRARLGRAPVALDRHERDISIGGQVGGHRVPRDLTLVVDGEELLDLAIVEVGAGVTLREDVRLPSARPHRGVVVRRLCEPTRVGGARGVDAHRQSLRQSLMLLRPLERVQLLAHLLLLREQPSHSGLELRDSALQLVVGPKEQGDGVLQGGHARLARRYRRSVRSEQGGEEEEHCNQRS